VARTTVEGSYATPATAPLRAEASAASWGAIVAGAVGATVVSLILMLLGSGMGLTAISPWSNAGVSAATLGVWAIAWLVVTQWISAGVGGYLAGRLRARWTTIPADEVFFRDTAHGFLAWALSILVAATLLGSALSGIAGSTMQAAAGMAGPALAGAQSMASGGAPNTSGSGQDVREAYSGYLVDRLLRAPAPAAGETATIVGSPAPPRDPWTETQRIIIAGFAEPISDDDRDYLARLVASRAGISPQEADTRIDETIARIESAKVSAQEAADETRKAAATAAIIGALSLVIGAFIASVAGALGGHLRDEP
jgi:hypothetical protein